MAPPHWQSTTDIITTLVEEPYDFNFYKAVNLLEESYYSHENININLTESYKHLDDILTFKSWVSQAFPVSEIFSLKPLKTDDYRQTKYYEMTVTFMGLAGATNPLPAPYTDIVLNLMWKRDYSLRDFLDLFNHRYITKMYQVKKKHAIYLDLRPPENNQFSNMLYALTGHHGEISRSLLPIPKRDLLFFSGLFAIKNRTALGLKTFLTGLCQAPVKLQECFGKWYSLEKSDCTTLGKNCIQLGVNTQMGTRAWEQSAFFRTQIGPIPWYRYLQTLPGSKSFQTLTACIEYYCHGRFEHQIYLLPNKEEIKTLPLTLGLGPQLGWTSWIKSRVPNNYTDLIRLSPVTKLFSHR